MNKTVKRGLLIAAGVVAACGVVWGGLTLARNANRGSVNVYAVSDFSMTDYWGDTSQTSGMVSTDDIQKLYLSDTQKVNKVYVQEGQTVRKGDKLLSYDTTLTSLDVERAQIAYDKQQYELEKAQKEFQRLLKAKDKEKLEEEIKELQDKIDELRKAKQQDIFNRDSEAIDRIETVDKLEPLKSPAGDGSKESPLYFNWNSQDEMTPENLAKLLPEGKATAYVVLVIHENDQTLGQIVNCCGLRLEWVNPTGGSTGGETGGTGETGGNTGTEPGGEGSDPATQTGEGGMVLPVMPAEEKKDTVKVFPAKLTEAPQIDIDGTTDEVLELEEERDALQEIADKAYTAEELPRMIGEKFMAIQEMDRAIKLAKLNLDQVKKEVGSDTVYSELDGTIKAVRDSNSAEFDKSQAVVEVSGGGGYYIDGAVSELELATVSIGETVQINSWMTGASCEGEIVEISDYPTDNANSWSDGNSNVSYYPFKVFVTEDADLQEGDWVEMSYQNTSGSADGNTLYLQSMFIRTENGKSYVMVRGENGKLEQRWVQTGRNLWGSYTQIRGGLTLEDFVAFPYGRDVTEGAGTVEATQDQLYNGM
mgnify:FL=1